jgi:hypothetical protein
MPEKNDSVRGSAATSGNLHAMVTQGCEPEMLACASSGTSASAPAGATPAVDDKARRLAGRATRAVAPAGSAAAADAGSVTSTRRRSSLRSPPSDWARDTGISRRVTPPRSSASNATNSGRAGLRAGSWPGSATWPSAHTTDSQPVTVCWATCACVGTWVPRTATSASSQHTDAPVTRVRCRGRDTMERATAGGITGRGARPHRRKATAVPLPAVRPCTGLADLADAPTPSATQSRHH